MSGIMSYFTGSGRRTPRQETQEAITNHYSLLQMLEKREALLLKKMDDETAKAKANSTSNKRAALNALRQRKAYEGQLDSIQGQRMTLENQINTLESANLNAETLVAMKKGSDALKGIHKGHRIDQVDTVMDDIREQMDITNEISDAISNPAAIGNQVDEAELQEELDALEQEQLDDRLVGADRVPVHTPASPQGVVETPARQREEEDDEEELRKLQAELAM